DVRYERLRNAVTTTLGVALLFVASNWIRSLAEDSALEEISESLRALSDVEHSGENLPTSESAVESPTMPTGRTPYRTETIEGPLEPAMFYYISPDAEIDKPVELPTRVERYSI
ncbi:MAG: hypothetical protein KC561_09105, partial [Myxococcales bacterium]|nr:hypothetical protein [Myxococcales bacterium]